jgi:hypothetical protein
LQHRLHRYSTAACCLAARCHAARCIASLAARCIASLVRCPHCPRIAARCLHGRQADAGG